MVRSNEASYGASRSGLSIPESWVIGSFINPLIMPGLPLPQERKIGNESYVRVAEHELNHALTAYALGAKVISISVIPNGQVLGATMVASRSPKEHQVIAAAGAVSTPSGTASGYVSDLFQVNLQAIFNNGMAEITALKTAQSVLNIYDSRIFKKAAEIIAFLGYVDGSMLGDILARAEWEIREMPKLMKDRIEEEKIREKYAFLTEKLIKGDKPEGIVATFVNTNPDGAEFISEYKPMTKAQITEVKSAMLDLTEDEILAPVKNIIYPRTRRLSDYTPSISGNSFYRKLK